MPAVASSTATWVSSGVNAPSPTPPTAANPANTVITGWRQQYPHSRRSQRGRRSAATRVGPGSVGRRGGGAGAVDVDGGTSDTVTR